MASTRDIRRRIKSVKNTRQITKAMELVAASKMKKAQQAAIVGRPYAQLMASMLASLAPRIEESTNPFLVKREVKTRGILLFTTDKGLCGPLNANLLKVAAEIKTPAKFVSIGRKGTQFLVRTKRDLLADFQVTDRVGFAEVRSVVEFLVKQYVEGVIDTIEVIFPNFKNTLVQEATIRPMLPLDSVAEFVTRVKTESGATPKPDSREMSFEPNAHTVLDALLPFYINKGIHQLILNSKASEHSARMVAMKTAKDNATKLLDDLTLEYNKARQAGITAEILEIAAAQFATA